MSEYSPLPWHTEIGVDLSSCLIVDRGGLLVASVPRLTPSQGIADAEADAAFIVKAANSHALLVEVLSEVRKTLQGLLVHDGLVPAWTGTVEESLRITNIALAKAERN